MNAKKLLERLEAYEAPVLGLWEAAEVFDVTKQALWLRRNRGVFPEPDIELKCSPIWTKKQLIKFVKQNASV